MATAKSNYSPRILIYLEIGQKMIRLADVLRNTATLHEPAEVLPNTPASLVISIDGDIRRQSIILHEGVTPQCTRISFEYPSSEVSFDFS